MIFIHHKEVLTEDRETHAVVPGDWRHGADIERWMPVELQSSNNYSTSAKKFERLSERLSERLL